MKKSLKNKKVININGLKFYDFDDILKEDLKSETFREAYNEELARLNLVGEIKKLRLEKKYTQKDLAQKAQMPQSVIARIESGEHSFSLGTLNRIAKVFNKEVQLV
jgi:DNA-binding XRE family transcriptional regulator